MANQNDHLSLILAQITLCLLQQNVLNAHMTRTLLELSKDKEEVFNRVADLIKKNSEFSEATNELIDKIKGLQHE